jgi:hypothetical protein
MTCAVVVSGLASARVGYSYDASEDACHLDGESVRLGGYRERTLRQGYFDDGLRAEGPDSFASGIPAAVQRVEFRLPTCGLVSCPPAPELLVPALAVSGGVDADMGSPGGYVSMRVHRDRLPAYNHHRDGAVRSPNRLAENSGPQD